MMVATMTIKATVNLNTNDDDGHHNPNRRGHDNNDHCARDYYGPCPP